MASPTPNPLLLVHGIHDTGRKFNKLARYLQAQGWSTIHCPDLTPNNGDVGLEQLAQQLVVYVDTHMGHDQPFDLVGFSMGGLISRYYVQRLGGIRRIQRFVTISAPHNGTWMGYGRFNPGCIQMRPNSQFLQDLNHDVEQLASLSFTSLWTPYDLMILPAHSSDMGVGETRSLPVLTHPGMLNHPKSLAAIATALSKPVIPEKFVNSLSL
ncbi:MAG: alpha/beta fold hydrolase [Cyanobacteria bacterium J06639_16]